MKVCKYMTTGGGDGNDGICANGDCPVCADYCPVPETAEICRYEDRGPEQTLVVVRGMKMPETCRDCPLAFWDQYDDFRGCQIERNGIYVGADRELFRSGRVPRPVWCPLVEATITEGEG